MWRRASSSLMLVAFAATSLRPVLGEGRRLVATGPARRGELPLEVFVALLPVVPIRAQVGDLSLSPPRVLFLQIRNTGHPEVVPQSGSCAVPTVPPAFGGKPDGKRTEPKSKKPV